MKTIIGLSILTLIGCSSIQAQSVATDPIKLDPVDASRSRTVPLAIYLPKTDGKFPVVLFSHGLGGSRDNNPYLGNHWAEHDYVAVFTQHIGSDEAVWKSAERSERMAAMNKAASLKNALDRFGDIPFVLDQLEKWNTEEGHPLAGKLDLEHIGLSGHSFGAVTVQALMGQKFRGDRDFADPRIDAFLLMSPSVNAGMTADAAFGHVESPVLCMTGTKDVSAISREMSAEDRMKVYAALPAGDKYSLIFEDGEHHLFSDHEGYNRDRVPHHHPAIQMISTKFWDAYLKSEAAAKTWLQSETPRVDTDLIEKDRWEWK